MRRRATQRRPRRPEAEVFRLSLLRARREMEWTQEDLARRLGVSKRTVSHWENGYWLPPFRQRIHVVVSLDELPSHYVLDIADGLAVSLNPVVAPILQRHREALDPPPPVPEPAPPPPPPPPRVPPDANVLRAALDAVVRDAADTLNVSANDLRSAIARSLDAAGAHGATLDEARVAVHVKPRPRPT